MSCSFASLPKYVFLPVCLDWLNLSEILSTDSAYCNHVERAKYIQLMTSSEAIFNFTWTDINTIICLKWLVMRGLHVRGLKVGHLDVNAIFHFEEDQLEENNVPSIVQYLWNLIGFPCDEQPVNLDLTCLSDLFDGSLASVDLGKCFTLLSCNIQTICRQNTRLTSINLQECSRVSDHILAHIFQCCPQLRDLNIADCSQVTDSGFESIVTQCHNLTALNLTAL